MFSFPENRSSPNMKFKLFIIVFIITLGLNRSVGGLKCSSDDFECSDGKKCIGKGFVCDEYPNCLDHSDEEPELCETWEYEYDYDEEDDGGGGGGGGWFGVFGGFGGSEEEYDDDEEDSSASESHDSQQFSSKKQEKEKCSLKECVPKGPLNFVDSREYKYSYEIETKTEAVHTSQNQTSSTLLKCDVIVQVLTACEMILKIENSESWSSSPNTEGKASIQDENNQFLVQLEQNPLRFAMSGGEIDVLCSSKDEDPSVLNFKRGVISTLQNTMPQLHLSHSQIENDVVGVCNMNYNFEGSNGARVVVSKTRDLSTCEGRSRLKSAAQGVHYHFPMESIPAEIVHSESGCRQEIEGGVIQKVSCIESHEVVPFSSDRGGVVTTVEQKLDFLSQNFFFTTWTSFDERKGLGFEHSLDGPASDDNFLGHGRVDPYDATNSFLDKLQTQTPQDSQQRESQTFRNLVLALRHLSPESFLALNRSRRWTSSDRRYFEDAVAAAGTPASLRYMAQEMPHATAAVRASWSSSLYLLQGPDEDMIWALDDFLRSDGATEAALLSGGALLNTYCLDHPSCASHEPILSVLSFYEEVIGPRCRAKDPIKKKRVVAALRGIGNAGLAVNDALFETLNECIRDESNEAEIVATAVESFRRIPCNVSRDALREIFTNPRKDSELRILSYLGLMKCANYETLHLVQTLFENEQVNQVGSFVWTHLKNIQETSLPSKVEIQSLLSNRDFEEKFKSDFRKFSKNVEWSGFFDPLNVGVGTESNIIFSEKSYVPRQSNFNLTADLFGKSFNILEVGARLEGFERFLEQLLTGEAPTAFDNKSIKSRSIRSLLKSSGRSREYLDTEPQMSLMTKVFGNDVWYNHMTGMEHISGLFKSFEIDSLIRDFKKGKELNVKKSFLPLETSYELATASGMPLKVQVEGAIVVDVGARLQFDASRLMEGKFVLNAGLKPSVSIDLKASMMLDAFTSSSGIEMDSSFVSSVNVDGGIEVDGKNAVSVDFKLPQETIRIFSANSKLFLVHGQPGKYISDEQTGMREEVNDKAVRMSGSSHCSSFKNTLALALCWEEEHPDVAYPSFNQRVLLNGRIRNKLELRKYDPSITSYKLRYQWKYTDENLLFYLLYDTPGSNPKREQIFKVAVNFSNKNAHLLYSTPKLTVEAKGKYIWSPEVKRLNVSLNVNGRGASTMSFGYKVHERGSQIIIIPIFKIDVSNSQLIKVTGNLESISRSRSGDSIHYGVKLQFDVDTSSILEQGPRGRGRIGGSLNKDDGNWELQLNVDYRLSGLDDVQSLNVFYERVMQRTDSLTKMIRSWKIFFTQFPYLNTKGKWASKSFDGLIENAIEASFGRDYENPLHQVDLFNTLIFYGGNDQTTFNSTVAIKYPIKKLDVVMGCDLHNDFRSMNGGVIFQFATGQALTSRLHMVRTVVGPLEARGSFHFLLPPWADVRMSGGVKQTDSTTYEFEWMGSVGSDYRLEATGQYENLSTRLKSLHELEMKVKYGSSVRNTFYVDCTFLYDQNQFVVASQVKTQDGSKYKLRVAYISELDDLTARHRRVEVDLSLPTKSYYWHSEIVIGRFITLSNDIHIDSQRDINLWIEISRGGFSPSSLKVKLLWDANRDPHKRANFAILLTRDSLEMDALVSFFGNEYKWQWTSSKSWKAEEGEGQRWSHDHRGRMSWNDERRNLNEISFGAAFNLTRNREAAEVEMEVFLHTPLVTWKENSARVRYSRSLNGVEASLRCKWHENEFLNLDISGGLKELSDEGDAKAVEVKVEVLSLINENPVSLNAGAFVARVEGGVEGSVFLQWDKDEVKLVLDVRNESDLEAVDLRASVEVTSSIEGFSNLGVNAYLLATKGSLTLTASAQKESASYQLKCIGVLYSAEEYIKGEIYVTTPHYGSDTASMKLRVYHDTDTHEEKLTISGHWLNEEFSLNGLAYVKPQDFRAAIDAQIPFDKLSQASLLLSYSTKDFYMSEVWVKWNRTKELGLKLVSRINDLTDLLLSFKVKTPFPKNKEVRGELRNLFKLWPSVRVNWKAFGQLDERKYGLGAVYEQGGSPKLQVGLEVYYPFTDLKEVKFLIADNSTSTNMRYNFELQHGEHKQIYVHTDFKQGEDSLEFSFDSLIKKLSFLGPGLEKVKLEGDVRIYSGSPFDFLVKLVSITPLRMNKIGAEGSFTSKEGTLEGIINLPLKYLEDLNYKVKTLLPEYRTKGYFNVELTKGRIPLFKINSEGHKKDFVIKFTTPLKDYSKGHLKYKRIPKDIQRSEIVGSASLEDKEIKFDGFVHLNHNGDVTKLEVDAESPLKGLKNVRVTLEGKGGDTGFSNLLKVSSEDHSYEGEIIYRFTSPTDWNFRAKVKNENERLEKPFSLELTYRNVNAEPILASVTLETPFSTFNLINCLVKIQTSSRPYSLSVEWNIPASSGNLEAILESFSNKRILGSTSLSFETPDTPFQTFTLKTDLNNKSTKDLVRLGLSLEVSSPLHKYDHIIVNGWLNQVTPEEPGVLTVYLVWPEMNPVNFTAKASYSGSPFDLRTNAVLDLTSAVYAFAVEEKREGRKSKGLVKIWWQTEEDKRLQEISLKSFLERDGSGGMVGDVELLLPMVPGFETNEADFVYTKKGNMKELTVNMEAGTISSSLELTLEDKEPGLEGKVSFRSSEFREGNPVTLNFYQETWKEDQIKGNCRLEWPVWDMKTRSYKREFIKGEVTHRVMPQGMEGTLSFRAPITNGREISLTYSFMFPKNPDATIKLGIGFDKISLELKLSHVMKVTETEEIKETSVELDNLLWPFGVAYIETVSLLHPSIKQRDDKLIIYDLQDTDRSTSLRFMRKSDVGGGNFSVKAYIVERELEFLVGYKVTKGKLRGHVLLSWSPTEKIDLDFQLEDLSQSAEERNLKLMTKISQPLRTVLLEGLYVHSIGKFLADVTLDTNVGVTGDSPMRGIINYEREDEEGIMRGAMKLVHPSLKKDITLTGKLDRTYEHPLLLNILLKYSESPENDLNVTAQVKRSSSGHQYEDFLIVTHPSSKLRAEAVGEVKLVSEEYSFVQDLFYRRSDDQIYKAKLDGGFNLPQKSLHALIETSKRLFDLRLHVQEKEEGHWELETLSETHEALPVSTSLRLHPSRPDFVLLIDMTKVPRNESDIPTTVEDAEHPRYLADKVVVEGSVEDGRSARLSVAHLREGEDVNEWTNDVDFELKLNNSKLVTSHFLWRKMIEQEIQNEILELMGITKELGQDAREWVRTAAKVTAQEAIMRAKPILRGVTIAVRPLLAHLREEKMEIKEDYILLFKSINMTEEETNLKQSIQYTIRNIAKSLNELDFVKKIKATMSKGTLRKHLQNLIKKIKEIYSSFLTKDPSMTKLVEKTKELLSNFASSYDSAVKRWYLLFRNTFEDFKMRLGQWLRAKWHNLYYTYKPHIFRTIHDVESTSYTMIKRVWEYMNELGANFKSLSYVQTMEQIYNKIKEVYEQMSSRTLRENLEMIRQYVSQRIREGVNTFFVTILPFVDDWLDEVKKAWKEISSYDPVQAVLNICNAISNSVMWTIEKLDFGENAMDVLAFSLEHGYAILTETAVHASLRCMKAKSDVKWSPKDGEIRITQKLPFSWNYFAQSPNYEEMLGLPYFTYLKGMFTSTSQFSVLDTWYKHFNLNFDASSWVPPFQAVSYVVGDSHLMTFDGRLIAFKGSCEHVLAADLVYGRWAVTVKYNKHTPKTINVYTAGRVFEFSKQFKVKVNDRLVPLPTSIDSVFISRTDGAVHLKRGNRLLLSWNLFHDVVSVYVAEESFLHTAGLLGTNNNEPTDDLQLPNGSLAEGSVKDFADAWMVPDDGCRSESREISSRNDAEICRDLFSSKVSPFRYCFYQVDPSPYERICKEIYSGNSMDTSPSAFAYRESCKENAVPIKLPSQYVKCEYKNATTNSINEMAEGETKILRSKDIENAVDVVIMIELKSCNKDRFQTKRFHRFVTMFSQGLKKEGVTSTRFALVSFGGRGENWNPSVVATDTEIFTSAENIAKYVDILNFGSEEDASEMEDDVKDRDGTFAAITYASNLAFESPVSVAFALFPCSACTENHGLDYPTMYHILLNNGAALFVFKEDFFDIGKTSMRKKIVGYDAQRGFTFKDHKRGKIGDSALKKQILPPKHQLNYCLPLALETNGAVFSSEFLLESKKKIERFGIIVGRRTGEGARVSKEDQRCLCFSTQEVTPLLRCDRWNHGDFSVLERYGLNWDPESEVFEDISDDTEEGFYRGN